MDLTTLKILLLFLLLLLTAVFGFLPLGLLLYLADPKDSVGGKTRKWLSRLSCFAGGVFLGTTLLHLQPEVHEAMEYVLKTKNINTDFPVAEFVIGCGFFLVILLDTIVMKIKYRRQGYDLLTNMRSLEDRLPLQRSFNDNNIQTENSSGYKKHMQRSKSCETFVFNRVDDLNSLETSFSSYKTTDSDAEGDRKNLEHCQIEFRDAETPASQAEEHHPIANSISVSQLDSQQKLRSILLLVAVSFHSIFGGLALGLTKSKLALWTLFIAISVHKSVIVFTIGLQLFQTQTVKLAMVSVAIFSLISPIGVAIGTFVSETKSQDVMTTALVSSILQGLATGTFLYVTFLEILQKELRHGHSVTKIFCILVGFSCMAGLSYLEGA
ncbi:zinc transporter ZIP3-like isoform X2 [Lingula anatina]|uniref:Zinc transporter ZIP3-like isoform X1 n=1 Tax=Lingula anatina TaxID=7574 RepID=A0A1S3K397_LINAN|nr:zinc transporter ZIP3-like isoform X1 [Lingula anatina]XP_013416902.1 zinc transporter ZIP3-like isoform X1 [Lingula anatina]XP_013416912.1 zinc transporter ZIP3-like isoform X2 [Lingula anatina]|eukprot:XP_013416894.1 zinc transporter ZIP3-like isoform X1 [Lingula anatina]